MVYPKLVTTNFDGIRVKDFLLQHKEIKSAAILFFHGFGDLLLFHPFYIQLKKELPNINFELYTNRPGLNNIVENIKYSENAEHIINVDVIFQIQYPEPIVVDDEVTCTKPVHCNNRELGLLSIPKDYPVHNIDKNTNKLVAVHLDATSSPGCTSPDKETKEKILNTILQAGYYPLDIHEAISKIKNIEIAYSLINSSAIFIGVLSGPLVLAMSMKPSKVICLEKKLAIKRYTSQKVIKCSIHPFKPKELLEAIKLCINNSI